MRYLLTNDDGIYSRGLSALYEELSKDADCLIVAPEVEQSAASHAITIARPLMVRRAGKNGRFRGYAVAGTPADCVKIGIHELSDGPIALVVSGINMGANLGVNILYSGTVSAAAEGVMLGVPSLAISLDTHQDADFTFAARFARKMAAFMIAKGPFINTVLNVNVPALPEAEIKGIAVTRQGQNMPMQTFDKRTNPRDNTYYWLAGEVQRPGTAEPDSDAGALHRGLISITPLHYDLTRHDALADLKSRVQRFF
ncbi:MAG: 5'/3'-nucleotidase SurE [Deltaproteobacteria bacterium]|nr:5'/3'-nucleotidase SurE [Deltaproteobacteria bacterium]